MPTSIRKVTLIVHPPGTKTTKSLNALRSEDTGSRTHDQATRHEAEGGPSGTNQPVLGAQENEEAGGTEGEQYPDGAGSELRQLLESILNDFNKIQKYATEYVRPAYQFPISDVRTPSADFDFDDDTDETEPATTAGVHMDIVVEALLELAGTPRVGVCTIGRERELQTPALMEPPAKASGSGRNVDLPATRGNKRPIEEVQVEGSDNRNNTIRHTTGTSRPHKKPRTGAASTGAQADKTDLEVGDSTINGARVSRSKGDAVETPNTVPGTSRKVTPGKGDQVVPRAKKHSMALRARPSLQAKEMSSK